MRVNIVRGNMTEAALSDQKGWIVGHFMSGGPAQTTAVEVKLWNYNNKFEYGQKMFTGTELIVVYHGTLAIDLSYPDGFKTTVRLCGSITQFVIIPPGYTKTVRVESAPASGVCVRWPSSEGLCKVV